MSCRESIQKYKCPIFRSPQHSYFGAHNTYLCFHLPFLPTRIWPISGCEPPSFEGLDRAGPLGWDHETQAHSLWWICAGETVTWVRALSCSRERRVGGKGLVTRLSSGYIIVVVYVHLMEFGMWEVVFYHMWVCGLLVEVKGMMLVMGNYGIRVRNGRYLLCTCMCTHQFVYPSCW